MSYLPNAGAVPAGLGFTRYLSQRDLSLEIPVNYVNVAGVSVTSACFPNNVYEDGAAATCISNLLAVGFLRFELDIYWDATRHVWSLCPVELGDASSVGNATTSVVPPATAASSTGSTGLTSTGTLVRRGIDVASLLGDIHLNLRQETSSSNSLTAASAATNGVASTLGIVASVSSTTTLSAGGSAPTASSGDDAGTLIEVGPYSCTSSVNFTLVTKIIASHLGDTQTNVNATLKYIIMNLHAAAPATDPTGVAKAPSPENLPQGSSLLNSIISANMSAYIYTPQLLDKQRSDLNASGSWFSVLRAYQPNSAYFQVDGSGDHTSTPNGWPSESIVEQEYARRLFASYGSIDPQMEGYNFSADASTIFPAGYLQSRRTVTASSNGSIESGCFFQPDIYSLSSLNNSWAVSSLDLGSSPSVQALTLAEAGNLTTCGISPILNKTLGGTTADQNYEAYATFVDSGIWSWGAGQPRNNSGPDDDDPNAQYRCAAINATSGYWRTEDCGNSHYTACRAPGDIYRWAISGNPTSYAKASLVCRDGREFTTPRTSLENAYLLRTWREVRSNNDIDDELLWVNFNDLDVQSCWVIGQNVTCPYITSTMDTEREVIVPVIAGVIVFVLAALTVFVKCAANRRKSKRRRRRGDDGWDYEGVPS